jgi:hypothetical protein
MIEVDVEKARRCRTDVAVDTAVRIYTIAMENKKILERLKGR